MLFTVIKIEKSKIHSTTKEIHYVEKRIRDGIEIFIQFQIKFSGATIEGFDTQVENRNFLISPWMIHSKEFFGLVSI